MQSGLEPVDHILGDGRLTGEAGICCERSRCMRGAAQVFRTYNASIVLDQLLHKESASESVDEKKGDYDRANKEARALPRRSDRGSAGLQTGL